VVFACSIHDFLSFLGHLFFFSFSLFPAAA